MLVLFKEFCLFQPSSGYFSSLEVGMVFFSFLKILKSSLARAGVMIVRDGAVRRMLA
jgi:hypothetical protein